MIRWTGILFSLLLTTHAQAQDPKNAGALVGKWKVVELTYSGIKVPAEDVIKKQMIMEFKGDTVISTEGGKKNSEMKYKAETVRVPFEIEFIGAENKKRLGIYRLEKDTLTICMDLGEKRPKKYESLKEPPSILMVLERMK